MNRDFDLQFWQSQSDTQRFAAAWELVFKPLLLKAEMLVNSDFKELLSILGN